MSRTNRKPGQQPLQPGVDSVVVQTRMTPAQRSKLERLGGAAWIRKRIDRAKEPEPKKKPKGGSL